MLGLALVFVLLTYGGWNEAAYISAELAGGRRAILRTLMVSLCSSPRSMLRRTRRCCTASGSDARAEQGRAGRSRHARVRGAAGDALSLFVAVATLTSINATMLVGARTNYAIGGDWQSLRMLAGWNAGRGGPTQAFLLQGARSRWRWSASARAEGRLRGDGRVHRAGVLGLSDAGRRRADRAAPARRRPRRARFACRLYPLTPIVFIAVVRVSPLFERRRTRSDPRRHSRVAAGDAGRRGGMGGHAAARTHTAKLIPGARGRGVHAFFRL